MGRLFEAEIRGLGRREDWDRGSKYEEEFLFKHRIAAVRATIPSYLGIFGTPEFTSSAVDSCRAGAREP